jgi:type II secretory ATPase GspE/PulE/Tfp pilus assembly ATPase PilB-like protein
MIDLIGTNPIFSSSIRMLMAQRLVRKLSDSKQAYDPDEATKKYVSRVLSGLDPEVIKENIGFEFNPDTFKLYKAVPAGEEDPFGFKGRNVIMEQMLVTEEIQKYIRGDVEDINTDAIEKTAREAGLITLEQKGIFAALRGETTIEEVGRVI